MANQRVNEQEVVKIRDLYANHNCSYSDLSLMFPLSRNTISNIVRSVTWKSVPNPNIKRIKERIKREKVSRIASSRPCGNKPSKTRDPKRWRRMQARDWKNIEECILVAGDDLLFVPDKQSQPTHITPGADKVRILRERVEAGSEMWNPSDATYGDAMND